MAGCTLFFGTLSLPWFLTPWNFQDPFIIISIQQHCKQYLYSNRQGQTQPSPHNWRDSHIYCMYSIHCIHMFRSQILVDEKVHHIYTWKSKRSRCRSNINTPTLCQSLTDCWTCFCSTFYTVVFSRVVSAILNILLRHLEFTLSLLKNATANLQLDN